MIHGSIIRVVCDRCVCVLMSHFSFGYFWCESRARTIPKYIHTSTFGIFGMMDIMMEIPLQGVVWGLQSSVGEFKCTYLFIVKLSYCLKVLPIKIEVSRSTPQPKFTLNQLDIEKARELSFRLI